jgi:NADPH-ferrihemoprotein reductase
VDAKGHVTRAGVEQPPSLAPCVVFFGARNRDHDFLYREEWAGLQQCGAVTIVHAAFSRDQESKQYVQHLIVEQAEQLCHVLISQRGMCFLAGNAQKMPRDVRSTLVSIFQQHECAGSAEQAQALLAEMDTKRRFQMETWA